ncbi:MAG: FeoA family protein, partial [Bacteroidota bacterium]
VGVHEHSTPFLQYLDRLSLALGVKVEIIEKFTYDESLKIRRNQSEELILSNKVAQNLFVQI